MDDVLSRNSYRIGIDVGGTFTKAALIDHVDGRVVGRLDEKRLDALVAEAQR